jgi:hypothetical protein
MLTNIAAARSDHLAGCAVIVQQRRRKRNSYSKGTGNIYGFNN